MASPAEVAEAVAAARAAQSQLLTAVQDTYISNLCLVSAATWLSYDICLTFPKEVKLVWRTKWSFPKVCFFFVRYYTLVSLLLTLAGNVALGPYIVPYAELFPSEHKSLGIIFGWRWFNGFNGTLLSAFFGDAIFLMRLYASYDRSKTILALLAFLFVAEFVTGIVVASLVVSSFSVTPRPPGFPLPGCLFTPPKHAELSLAVWLIALVVATICFFLVLYKFTRNLSFHRSPASSATVPVWQFSSISPLVFAFVRDSAFYFFLVFMGNLMNVVFEIVFVGRAIIPMGTVWLMAIYSVSASRLCINTRESLTRKRKGVLSDTFELDERVSGPTVYSSKYASRSAVDLHNSLDVAGQGPPSLYSTKQMERLRTMNYDEDSERWVAIDRL